jgi:hypothetical protein
MYEITDERGKLKMTQKFLPGFQLPAGIYLKNSENLLKNRRHIFSDCRRALADSNAGGTQCLHLVRCRSLATGNNRTCMTHAPAGRSSLSCDEGYDRLIEVVFGHPGSGIFFGRPADFTNENHRISVVIISKD